MLVGVASTQSPLNLVEPGSADDSYLWRKLEGTQAEAEGSGGQMPLRRPPLSEEDLGLIEAWISAGAPR